MTIAVDFDGVIHQYSKGWQDGTIYDPPVEGALDGLRTMVEAEAVFIFTSRDPEQVMTWLEGHGFYVTPDACCGECPECDESGNYLFWNDTDQILVTNRKIPARVYLDDRAVRFTDWASALQTILGSDDE